MMYDNPVSPEQESIWSFVHSVISEHLCALWQHFTYSVSRTRSMGRVAYLEIEEHCEQAEEHGHGRETKYEEGFPPDSFYH